MVIAFFLDPGLACQYRGAMNDYTKVNIAELVDQAPNFGMDEVGEARFARRALGAERVGMAYYRINPGRRLGFGHHHEESEEAYLMLSGSGRFRVGDDVFDVTARDVVYVAPQSMREWEAGDDGLEMVAFGSHSEAEQPHMEPGWWTD